MKIKKATGFPKKKLIHFDSPELNGTKEESFAEKNKFSLDDINASDFQNFLEDVHHANEIDDGTVDGINSSRRRSKNV